MATTESFQHPIVEALAPQADPVHPSLDQGPQIAEVKAGWIHFQGDFRAGLKAELAA